VIWQGSVLAGKLKKVRDNAIAWSFSPDGSSLAVTKSTRINGPMSELWLMDTNGDDLRKLDDAGEGNAFGFVQWSPDGNRIAYLRYVRKSGEFRRSMESRDLKGGPPATLLSDNALRSLYWLQMGVYFTSLVKATEQERPATTGSRASTQPRALFQPHRNS
jgi:dipeptidyl aminopeptidase/acylaminoacyl peptidase